MKRISNQFSFAIAIGAVVLLAAACGQTAKEDVQTARVEKKPNIIFILADDLGYGDVSCYGQERFATPHIDKLAAGGMRFTQHYAGSTVCAPSRSVLLTGLHTGHTPVRGNRSAKPEGQAPIAGATVTVAEVLKKAGYVTGAFGKWGLGPPGSEGDPVKQGFDEFYGYNCQSLAHRYYPQHLWHNTEKIMLTNTGAEPVEYAHDSIQSRALKFIEKNKDSSFFLFLPYTLPHAELMVPDDSLFQKFKGKFPEKSFQGFDYGENFRTNGYASQAYPHATFAAMVTRLDVYVGQIMDKLAELDLAGETLVIFTSDNGPHREGGGDPDFFKSYGPLRGTKRDLYEGGIRVPFIASWQGRIEENSESDHISAFWDLLPTACEVAGLEQPEGIDGISYLPVLTGAPQPEHEHLYWEFYEEKGKQAVRMGRWKGVRLNVQKDRQAPIELYDLSGDLAEQNNVAAGHPDIVQQIAAIMDEEHRYSEDFHFAYEDNE